MKFVEVITKGLGEAWCPHNWRHLCLLNICGVLMDKQAVNEESKPPVENEDLIPKTQEKTEVKSS